MTSEHDLQQRLLCYLRANVPCPEQLEVTTDLLELGVIDSLMVADLFVLMETKFGVVLSGSDVAPRNFRSIESLAALIFAKQQKAALKAA